jgi:hypothetical protein
MDTIEPYRREIFSRVLYSVDGDGHRPPRFFLANTEEVLTYVFSGGKWLLLRGAGASSRPQHCPLPPPPGGVTLTLRRPVFTGPFLISPCAALSRIPATS